jgi:CDP-diacylglycerol--serine O-phosphatidyltransferase
MVPFYMGFLGLIDDGHRFGWIIAPYIMLVAFLMVSRVPTFSGKSAASAVPREDYLPVLAAAALAIVCLVAFPWTTLLIIWVGYICLLPFSIRRHHQLKARDAAAQKTLP